MDTGAWTRENMAWLAGLLEGEGSFLLMSKTNAQGEPYPVFTVQMNTADRDVLEKAARIAGAGEARGPFEQKNPKHKPFYRWQVAKRDEVYALCVAIYPFMGDRRRAKIGEILKAYKASGFKGFEHGTPSGYQHHGCRCPLCRSANAARARDYRAAVRERETVHATSV